MQLVPSVHAKICLEWDMLVLLYYYLRRHPPTTLDLGDPVQAR